MSDNIASTINKKKCDLCVATTQEFVDVQFLISVMEDKIMNLPSFMDQIVNHLQSLQQECSDLNRKLSKPQASDNDDSNGPNAMPALCEKLDLIPAYMEELKEIHSTLHKDWLEAKTKLLVHALRKANMMNESS